MQKTYCRKHQSLHNSPRRVAAPAAIHNIIIFLLGARQAARLSRSIFPGAIGLSYQLHPQYRAQKGYLRISLARCTSCIAATSPAITSAPLVRSDCAPEIWPHSYPEKLLAKMPAYTLRT